MTGLGILPEGIGVARVVRPSDQDLPHIHLCDFVSVTDEAERAEALTALVAKHGLEGGECISVMPAGTFTLLLVNAPEVEATELRAAVRWRIKDLIDFHIDDAVIDVFDVPGQQERGRPKMMYVVAAHTKSVREHIDLVEASGFALSTIDIPELVQRNVAVLLPEEAGGVALLHLSRRSGLLTLSRDGVLYLSRTLDVGVDQLLAEVAADGGSEDGDMTLESGADEGGMPYGLQRLLDGVVLEVQRSLDYYESHFALPPVGGLVLAPLERSVPGMLGYLANNLGVPVRMLDLNALVESDSTLDDALQARCFHAIGAALRVEEKAL